MLHSPHLGLYRRCFRGMLETEVVRGYRHSLGCAILLPGPGLFRDMMCIQTLVGLWAEKKKGVWGR